MDFVFCLQANIQVLNIILFSIVIYQLPFLLSDIWWKIRIIFDSRTEENMKMLEMIHLLKTTSYSLNWNLLNSFIISFNIFKLFTNHFWDRTWHERFFFILSIFFIQISNLSLALKENYIWDNVNLLSCIERISLDSQELNYSRHFMNFHCRQPSN